MYLLPIRISRLFKQYIRPPKSTTSPLTEKDFSLYRVLFAAYGIYSIYHYRKKISESCGIIGYVGSDPKAIDVLLHGLTEIQNRGYDSAGVATYHDGEVLVTKFASDKLKISDSIEKIKQNADKHTNSCLGIGHTRWATHGGVNDENAHPHSDHKNRIFVAHNGTITNTHEIRSILAQCKIPIKSETDTELIALLIGMYLDEGHSLKNSIKLALQRLDGTWGLAILSKDEPNQIIVARKGSPMLVGIGENELYVGSEQAAFSKFTKKYMALEEDEIWALDPKKMEIEKNRIEQIDNQGEVSLGCHTHWTIKEIEEQPESVARAMNFGARLIRDGAKLGGLEEIKEKLLEIKNLAIIGCGTSYHAAMFGAHLFKSLEILNSVQALDASETTLLDIPKENPGVIAISQSGETRDLIEPVSEIVKNGITAISIVNVVGSQLARLTKHGVYMNSGREIGVASTKSFMNSCVVLTEIALWLSAHLKPEDSEKRKSLVNHLLKLPLQIGSVIAQNKEVIKEIASEIINEEHMFVLGRGLAESIAKEGALKIKEITRVHAEGYPGGALKHGPFALINDGTPIILIILNDDYKDLMNLALAEVTGRGAKTIVITSDPALITTAKPPNKIIKIEEAGPLTALLSAIPMQMLAYYLSIMKGLDPDHPRGLAKVVTVR
ncbi:unnamed protein product [Blepharisma stoltei]|uniref:Glutamine--fructose-6-phosphate aminotransferase [isomerizing] n=1 Tax=Blepharisma stoltei TaxID=1481888 RepID=A0AAU9IDI2_9CILI|nr:unnamed protein product [Blepharisma stoltei]